MVSIPRHKKEEKPPWWLRIVRQVVSRTGQLVLRIRHLVQRIVRVCRVPVIFGSLVVAGATLVVAGATLLAPLLPPLFASNTSPAPSASAPESSSQPSASPSVSRSAFSTGTSPMPTDSPSLFPTSSPTAAPTSSPSPTAEPVSPPASPIPTRTTQTSVPTGNPEVSLAIKPYAIPVIPGTDMYLAWTPTVTYDGQIVMQNCQITWSLYEGETLIGSATSSCSGSQFLKLPIGNYRLVGRVRLSSGQSAQTSVNIPAPSDPMGDSSEPPAYAHLGQHGD